MIFSCSFEKPVDFRVNGSGAELRAYSKAAAAGIIDFKKPYKLEYNFMSDTVNFSPASLEIEYSFSFIPGAEIKNTYQLIFETQGDAWLLPMDFEFAGIKTGSNETFFHYAIPLKLPLRHFTIRLEPQTGNADKTYRGSLNFQIHSLELKERWYGFYRKIRAGRNYSGSSFDAVHLYASPFVYTGAEEQYLSYVIDPPRALALPEFWAVFSVDREAGKNAALTFGSRSLDLLPGPDMYTVPGTFFPEGYFPMELSGPVTGFEQRYADVPRFPLPLSSDPGLILQWPLDKWRDERFEIFRWDRFPSLLIFDTADYEVQDRLFKRLAFFVEKAGFRGRLAPDAEIAGLHGWNAHDYKANDLAVFFETARISNFPLLREENELREILVNEGIIRINSDGVISGAGGGIISVSRSSPPYLRSLFMAHEGFHGLFFIDEDFRQFCTERWDSLPKESRAFIRSYFDYQRYDIGDEYLMLNEFMAHILQQPVRGAAVYFGQTLPLRLEASPWRRPALGEKDTDTNSWPVLAAAFTREAQAFSDYVSMRWFLSGGRVWLIN